MPLKALPTPIKVLFGLLIGLSLSGVVQLIEPRLTLIYLLGFVAIILLYLLYLFVAARLKKRQSSGFGAQINATNTQAPSALNDPAKRARLDDLRRNFEKGVERYRVAGKDIYSLPWLLVVGEPGSGKTEAIRHSNVGFPPGLQDELQGVGGTINMNWWFTNRAVVLDTAGRLMFEEVEAGSGSEWREFLSLLRKNRPNCPINGMLLVIPVDTLIKDTTDQIAKKAAKIAQQLDVIQRTLDVRFPVFVVLTKCDLINGFREFFDNLTDPQLQHQILGWSNPAPLDEPFHAEQIDQHLKNVADSLAKRRLALLRDPVPEKAGGRRTDEVDAFYSLPTSIMTIAPRLRRYLETIFVAGEWSAKPLFLRGLYFSSAMREGSALDLELAQAIGVSVESLPEGKAWVRDRAYFLRDLFLEKVFRERGLVTRASNTRQLMRRRRLVLLSSVAVSLLLVIGLSVLGYSSLYRSVGRESAIWKTVSTGWDNGTWNPIVTPELKGSSNYTFNGAQPVLVGSERVPLLDYHERLRQQAQKDIKVPWIFWPLEATVVDLNPSRRQAQKTVFEVSVLRPLVDAARTRILNDKGPWTPAASQALSVLLRIEGMIRNPDVVPTADDVSADTFLLPLLRYVSPQATDTAALGKTFEATYLATAADRKHFPPAWMSGGANLVENRALATGLKRFFAQAQNDQKSLEQGYDLIRSVRAELRGFRQAEEELTRVANSVTDPAELTHQSDPIGARLVEARTSVDHAVKKLATSGVVDENFASLQEAAKTIAERSRASTDAAFNSLQSEINRYPGSGKGDYTIPAEVTRLLKTNLQDLRDRVQASFTAKEEQELEQLDALYASRNAQGARLYTIRGNLLERALTPSATAVDDSKPVIGSLDSRMEALRVGLKQVEDSLKTIEGRDAARAQATTRALLVAGEYGTIERLLRRYRAELDKVLADNPKFPLFVAKSGDATALAPDVVKALAEAFRNVPQDLAVLGGNAIPSTLRNRLDGLPARAASVASILEALGPGPDNQPAQVALSLIGYPDQKKLMAQRLNTEEFAPRFAGFVWRTFRVGGNRFRTEAPAAYDLGKYPLMASGFAMDFYRGVDDPNADRTYALAGDWAIVRLLHLPTTRRRAGGKEWEIMLPLKDDKGAERYVSLLLQFEKPLPEIADWPAEPKAAGGR